ncbi:peptidoglycan/xylan/chitin deacetylase (PgdA/CDA1 family) [Bacillus pakistanensis]|uniref:Peptidoglycan/xylan/chitin deacetylase (PgdA/CDA1 family) n=1 Tax=Rossellomorea pakistanensis TaxID=992288 RepID=A0ABS2NFP3_9BACI|nr:polysaccharide deacetylase family protein [Bacillus pakistanensis]MBM7586671.1 peptidoglycan/xylan/chitin deacetylase (PgdA/CDA1 family) [Bacillus pakistanensis]
MKKFIVACVSILLLTACTQDATLEKPKETEFKTEEKKEQDTSGEEKKAVDERNSEEEAANEEVKVDPQYKVNPGNWSIEPIDDANSKVVLLTIDDAPDKHALEMAKTLKKLDAKAIFFVNGHFLDTPKEKEALKQIHDLGFIIGNHTYSHRTLSELSIEEQQKEIVSLSDTVESITGERPKFFRAPFGDNTDFSKQVVNDQKMSLMNWTYGYDWETDYQTGEAIAEIMVNSPYLTDGANLLMHDREWTNEGLEAIVNGLREKGYEILDPNLIQTPEG